MKKRKLKKSVIKKGAILFAIIIIIVIIIKTISTIKYHKTDEYKLKKIGYTIEEINTLEKLSENNLNYVLNNDYNENIINIINQKYYIEKNFERYINYQKQNPSKDINKIISLVNVNADNKYYTNETKTDTTKGELMLVNKYNYLEETYQPSNINKISVRYAYNDNYAPDDIIENYKKMHVAAEKEGIKLVISSGYRSYQDQQETYEYYKRQKGEEYANTHAAIAGHSEHQTGLAFDILTLNATTSTFETTEEFAWLQENGYKYGFIMRYPKGAEDITGFEYEPWHYRYVGTRAAQIIHDEKITFDEYYAYYVENK